MKHGEGALILFDEARFHADPLKGEPDCAPFSSNEIPVKRDDKRRQEMAENKGTTRERITIDAPHQSIQQIAVCSQYRSALG